MEVKLIAGDGCWRLHNLPEWDILPTREVVTTVLKILPQEGIVMTDDPLLTSVKTVKRRYRLMNRDSHGTLEYLEDVDG